MMTQEINFDEVLGKYRSDPFEYVDVRTKHTGQIRLKVREGSEFERTTG
jgi:hypothetical protein